MSHYTYSFENLEVWQNSMELSETIYGISRSFPDSEKFGITSQIRRSVVSVGSNLAEGSGRTGPKDQAHFTQLSYSSLMEVTNLLILSFRLQYISKEDYDSLRNQIQKLSNGLNALRRAQLQRT